MLNIFNMLLRNRITPDPIGSYRGVVFSEIKFKSSPNIFIDIRQFQRGYDDEGEETYYPTKVGFRIRKDDFLRKVVEVVSFSPNQYVHPKIIKKVSPLLATDNFESAIFESFKIVEILIRNKSNFDKRESGISMIRRALDPNKGPLADKTIPLSEREAFSHYVAGTFGFYRNSSGHRDVPLSYSTAFEAIVVASNIYKIIEKTPL